MNPSQTLFNLPNHDDMQLDQLRSATASGLIADHLSHQSLQPVATSSLIRENQKHIKSKAGNLSRKVAAHSQSLHTGSQQSRSHTTAVATATNFESFKASATTPDVSIHEPHEQEYTPNMLTTTSPLNFDWQVHQSADTEDQNH